MFWLACQTGVQKLCSPQIWWIRARHRPSAQPGLCWRRAGSTCGCLPGSRENWTPDSGNQLWQPEQKVRPWPPAFAPAA